MIGDKTRTDIVLGYSVEPLSEQDKKIFDPWGKSDILKQIPPLQKDIEGAIKELRAKTKGDKQRLEAQKVSKMKSGDEETRHDWLFKEYVPALRRIGVTTGAVQTKVKALQSYKTFAQAINNGCSLPKQDSGKYVTLKVAFDNSGLSICKMVANDKLSAAFILKFTTEPEQAFTQYAMTTALARDVYYKKWSGDQGQQYVKDDDGVFTRRYGYADKSFEVLNLLLEQQFLEGKYVSDAGAAKTAADATDWNDKILNLTKEEKNKYEIEAADGKLSVRQMLFVHQELGSGDSQRGICLTSTPTYAIPSNQGVFFSAGDTFKIKVDFALVPTGKQLLYNLYKPEAQAKAQPVAMTKWDKKQNDYIRYAADATHMLDSVSKNREIFLRVLVPAYIENLAELKVAVEKWKAKKEAERVAAEKKRQQEELARRAASQQNRGPQQNRSRQTYQGGYQNRSGSTQPRTYVPKSGGSGTPGGERKY